MLKAKVKVISRKFFLFIFIGIIFFYPLFPSSINDDGSFFRTRVRGSVYDSIVISEDTLWKKKDKHVLHKMVVVTKGATLTIEKGAQIIFKQDNNSVNPFLGLVIADGKMIARGETNDPIVFTSENNTPFNIRIESEKEQSFWRYVTVEGGGFYFNFQAKYPKFKFGNRAYAFTSNAIPALQIRGGKIHIENSQFRRTKTIDVKVEDNFRINENGQEESHYFPEVEIINSNFSSATALISQSCRGRDDCVKNKVHLKDDWYGSPQGANCKGAYKVEGDYTLDDYKKIKEIVDPVIFIPGILGSDFDREGNLRVDTIWHKYDNLISSFQANGFILDKNFFLFPYDWRRSNAQTAILLKYKIKQVQKQTKISQVDIVAHSMGGLVARSYAERDNYAQNIDQLIFLGTPHRGAPKAYLMWEAGKGYFWMLENHLKHEAKEKGYDNLGKYVREKVPSVRELLPVYDYLFDIKKNKLRDYFNGYPRNEFLEELNQSEKLANLENLDIFNIVGKLKKDNTIGKIKVTEKTFKDKWMDGMPLGYDENKLKEGLAYANGDATVPLKSAMAIMGNINQEMAVSHTQLPTQAQCFVLADLYGKVGEEFGCNFVNKIAIPNILLFRVFSPVDIAVIDPQGRRIGKNFSKNDFYDEIENAYYSGWKTDTEFISIPNPLKGDYKILTQGTGMGNYVIEVTQWTEKEDGTTEEKEKKFQGTTSLNQKGEIGFIYDENFGDETEEAEKNESNNNNDSNQDASQENSYLSDSGNDDIGNTKENDDKKSDDSHPKKEKESEEKKILASTNLVNTKTKNNFNEREDIFVEKKDQGKILGKELEKNNSSDGSQGKVFSKQSNGLREKIKWLALAIVFIIAIIIFFLKKRMKKYFQKNKK